MFWKTTKIGDKRTISAFALFPEKLSDGNTVCLGFFKVEQEYCENQITRPCFPDFWWIECVPGWKIISTHK